MQQQLLEDIARRIFRLTVTKPIYGSKFEFFKNLEANGYKIAVKTPIYLVNACDYMYNHVFKRAIEGSKDEGCTDIKVVQKLVKIGLKKRINMLMFETFLQAMLYYPAYCLEGAIYTLQPEEGSFFLGAMHKIDAEEMNANCAVCDNDFTTVKLCKVCDGDLLKIKRTPGYHEGKFKNDVQAVRRYRECEAKEIDFRTYILKKKDYKPLENTPTIKKQPERDFDLLDLPGYELTRSQQRMKEYVDKIRDAIPKVIPHDFDPVSLFATIKNMLQQAYDSGFLVIGALAALTGATVIAITVAILRSDSPYISLMLKVLAGAVLVATLSLGVGSAYANILQTLSEMYDNSQNEKAYIDVQEAKTYPVSNDETPNLRSTLKPTAKAFEPRPVLVESDDEVEFMDAEAVEKDLLPPGLFANAMAPVPHPEGNWIGTVVEYMKKMDIVAEFIDMDCDGKWRTTVVCEGNQYMGLPQSSKKKARQNASYQFYLAFIQEVKVTPHVGDDRVIKVVEQMMTETTKAIAKSPSGMMRSTLDFLHTTATTARDVKTVVDLVQPVVETIVGAVYETVTGKPWLPWSQRGILELLNPILAEHEELLHSAERAILLHTDETFQKKVQMFQGKLKNLEDILMKSRTPPRYLVPVVAMRNDAENWVQAIIAARKTAHDRVEPVCVGLFGDPGVGKTTVIKQLYIDAAATINKVRPAVPAVWNDNMVYAKKTDTDFWDGYKRQPWIQLDDLWQTDDPALRRAESMFVINLVNRAAYQLNMADLPEKSNVFADPVGVSITRNGNAKLTNLGVISTLAVDRRIHLNLHMKTVGTPSDPSSWRFDRYGPGGVKVQDNMTYLEVLHAFKALVLLHNKLGVVESKPIEDKSEVDLEKLGLELKRAHDAAVRSIKPAPPPQPARGFRGVHRHGSVIGIHSEEEVESYENLEIELQDILKTIDQGMLDDDTIVQYAEDIDTICAQIGLPIARKSNSLADLYEEALQARNFVGKRLLTYWESLKKWTVSTWEKFTNWVTYKTNRASAFVASTVLVKALSSAYLDLVEWIQTSTLAKILVAFTAIALVGGALTGLVFGAKKLLSSEDKKIEPQSRSEKEDKRDREIAKAERKAEQYEIREGRAHRKRDGIHNAEGKLLPQRMRQTEHVDTHVRETDYALANMIVKNIYAVFFQTNDGFANAQIAFLAGGFATTCRHVATRLRQCSTNIMLTQIYVQDDKACVKRFAVPVPRIIMVEKSEVVFLDFGNTVPPHHDITKHLATDADALAMLEYGVPDVQMVYRDPNGEKHIVTADFANVEICETGHFEADMNGMYAVYNAHTVPGSSGALTLTSSSAWPRKLFAMHGGAAMNTAYDMVLTIELFKAHCGTPTDVVTVPHLDLVSGESVPPKDEASPVGILKHGHAAGGKNSITPSPLSPFIRQDPVHPFNPSTIPTVMYDRPAKDVHDRWVSAGMLEPTPYEDAVLTPKTNAYKVAPPFKHIPQDLFDVVYDPDDVPNIPGGVYHVLSFEQAVFGEPRLGIAPIDFTTSPGYNWNPEKMPVFTRYALFGMDRNNPQPTKFEQWHPELRKELLHFLAVLGAGHQPVSVVVDSLKAERRGPVRVLKGQTRLFYAGSIVHLIVSRMFTGHLSAVEKDAPTINVPAVGIVPTSREWGELRKRLSKHPNIIVTDQVNFDMHNQTAFAQNMGAQHAAGLLMNKLSTERIDPVWNLVNNRNLTRDDFRHCLTSLYVSTCMAVHVSGTNAYLDTKTTNSGVDRTTQVNSYRNKTGIRMSVHSAVQKNLDLISPADRLLTAPAFFRKHVETALYGDDQAIAVSDALAVILTPYVLANETYELLGGKMTTATKEPITPATPFTPWSEVELLKRGFIYQEGITYAPLQRKVIEDSLHWVHKGAKGHAIAADTVRSALLEAALHGREYYDLIHGVCHRACQKASVKFAPLSFEKVRQLYTE